jgi:hypothetical protein
MRLSDQDLLRQAVESTTPKDILLKVLRSHGDEHRRKVVNVLKVDVKTVQPIYIHQHYKYKRKEYRDNLFMFLDKNYKIMAFLKGTEWDSRYSSAEHYNKESGRYAYTLSTKKTRPTLWNSAFHILMFKSEDIDNSRPYISYDGGKFRDKNYIEIERRNKNRDIKNTLNDRVFAYKTKKYEHLSFDDLVKMVGEMMVFSSKQVVKTDSWFLNFSKNFYSEFKVNEKTPTPDLVVDYFAGLISTLRYRNNELIECHTGYREKEYLTHKFHITRIYKYFFDNIRNYVGNNKVEFIPIAV